MLVGEFEQRLDEKNRLTVPVRLRASFADGAVVTRYFDGCVSLFPRATWDTFVGRELSRLDPLTAQGRWMQRFLYGSAAEVELDRQGRLALSAPLAKHASLDKEIVVTGVLDRIEIWDRDAWHAGLTEFGRSAEDAAESLAKEPHR